MSTTDILTALVTRLDSLVLSPALPVIWPGMPDEPPSTGMWLEASFFPGKHRDLAWGNSSQYDARGFFQVAVYYRPGINTGQNSQVDAAEVADLVIAHFPKGLEIDSVRIHKGAWQGSAVDLEGKSFIPVTISYRGIVSKAGYSGALTTPVSKTTTDILTAFLERLDAVSLSPDLPVAWPGIHKTPPSTGMWLETNHSPKEPDDLMWDDDSQQYLGGSFDVSVYWRPGSNTGQSSQIAASTVADLIIDHFPKGYPINAVRVMEAPWQSPAVSLKGKSFIRVTIPYSGLIAVDGYRVGDTYYVVNGGVYVVNNGIQVVNT